jgi:hypothetical protein
MDQTTENLEKRLHTLIYQYGLKHFITMLEGNETTREPSPSTPKTEDMEVIKLNEILSNNADSDSESTTRPVTPEPSHVEMTPEHLSCLINETYNNVVQFANSYSNIFIAPYDQLTAEETEMLVKMNDAYKIKEWMENHLSTPEDKFPDILKFDSVHANTTTSGYKSYIHLYDDLFILMNEDVVVYQNKHQYTEKVGKFLGALELCIDLTNLILTTEQSEKLPVDQSDFYEEIDRYIRSHTELNLTTYMMNLIKDYGCSEEQTQLLTTFVNLELYNSSLNEQIYMLDLLKVFSFDQAIKLTKDDTDMYRRYYQYKMWDISRLATSDPKYAYFSTHIPLCGDLEKVKRVLRHWSTINNPTESTLLPLI